MPRLRTALILALAALAASFLSGCVAIKQQVASQPRLPGFVTLRVDVCVADHNKDTYLTCNPNVRGGNEGTAEPDNGFDGDELGGGRGQLLVGYRVPNGSTGPISFISQDGQLTLTRNPAYTNALTASFAPPAGFHWEGYLSSETPFDPGTPGDRTTSLLAEFSLPPGPNGAPFSGPYRWRPMVGFRATGAGNANPNDAVNCAGTQHTICFDSPGFSGTLTTHLTKAVSDIGVLPGSTATVTQGFDATVNFPIENLDPGSLGARTLGLSATTTVPGGAAQLASSSVTVPPNSTTSTGVTVVVPANTPPGDYRVTLTATANAGTGLALTRVNTGTITVLPAAGDPPSAPVIPAPSAAPAVAPPPGRINVTIAFDFPSATKSTTFTRLQVKGAPSGATVSVTCKGKCPARKFTKRNAPRTLTLKPWLKKPLRAGTVLTVTVTKPGSFGMVKTFTVRANKRPQITTRCLQPGSRTARASCAG